ncbi:putative L-lysine-epsilon aminotransferase [Enhygromyxa salina]|uniref:Putative L-lysine-epsilon aminotransferase n=1 Tax=Enhygromyxa salina TaxID=215803 RepID=A0A2S9Y2M6_9BACT|nr:aminotransferase class III-fold pyridoxal phosphate-dependent enzyme [Enhygromyxa salina]PRP99367.1 putative L-lysine-epsilon aminotransferase [Enhygromyxa salina]
MSRDPQHSRELELLETRQREEAPAADLRVNRETSRVRIPEQGALPRSAALLERLYHGELVPRERKPQVIDTRRSCGPFMVSVDEPPMVLLDACSQIATLSHGFAHPGILAGLHEGRFDGCLWANPDSTVTPSPELDDYGAYLLSKAPAGLDHATFVCAGGAEANEKALRIARLNSPDPTRRRVLAFEGSFHGRTLVSLGATSNPAKRKGVDMPGFEAIFCPRDLDALAAVLGERGGELYAVIVEPMMAEGGDIHLAREFLLGVRELSRAHGLPLIIDEVQTGFGTSGSFFWWTHLGLGDTPETAPDLITCAKKAGLGVVLSRWADPEPAPVNVASALRGLIQAETAELQAELEAPIRERLHALAAEFPELVSEPRVAGTAFAFDLPSAKERDAFIGQRFARGFMTYHAGERTIRFRLASCWELSHLDDLFARVATALRRLDDPSAAVYEREGGKRQRFGQLDIREITEEDWAEIMALEQRAYEPARADSEEFLRATAEAGLGLVARDGASDELLGFVFAAGLEHYAELSGPDQDPNLGTGNTLYAADLTVSEGARGRGVGRALKSRQIQWAREHGYTFVSGRNRIGLTTQMAALNRSFGAYTAKVLENQYGGDATAEYYRIPLRSPAPAKKHARGLDLASGLQAPFGPRPEFMATRELVGPTASRLNLSNWATPDSVHYFEHLRAILPRGTGHLYTTSSRDELLDKSLRCLKMARAEATIAVGFEGGYLGHTTASARSLSDPAGFGEGFALFDWPRIPHPEDVGVAASVAALQGLIDAHGAAKIVAVFVELVGERSGRVLGSEAALALAKLCKTHDIPLAVVETASGGYRSGAGAWGLDGLDAGFCPNLVLWYPGGQLGQIFIDSRWWNGAPLQLISTWDGDELSQIRTHEHLRAAHRLELGPAINALHDLAHEAADAIGEGARVGGIGLYRTLSFGDPKRAAAVLATCRDAGLLLGRGLPDTLTLVPALDVEPAALRGPARTILLDAISSSVGG